MLSLMRKSSIKIHGTLFISNQFQTVVFQIMTFYISDHDSLPIFRNFRLSSECRTPIINNLRSHHRMSVTSKTNRNAKKLRIVFLGDQGVGKTSIIERYSSGRFDEHYNSTVGIDFNVRDVNRNGIFYRLQMWDTAGQERYRSLIPTYLKNAHCVVFVYDVTKGKSLQNLASWYKMFTEHQVAPGIVVANKTDLTASRKVERIDGEKFSKENSLFYIQVSAKNGKKISDLFDLVLETVLEAEKETQYQHQTSRGGLQAINAQTLPAVQLQKQTFAQRITKKCCQQQG